MENSTQAGHCYGHGHYCPFVKTISSLHFSLSVQLGVGRISEHVHSRQTKNAEAPKTVQNSSKFVSWHFSRNIWNEKTKVSMSIILHGLELTSMFHTALEKPWLCTYRSLEKSKRPEASWTEAYWPPSLESHDSEDLIQDYSNNCLNILLHFDFLNEPVNDPQNISIQVSWKHIYSPFSPRPSILFTYFENFGEKQEYALSGEIKLAQWSCSFNEAQVGRWQLWQV